AMSHRATDAARREPLPSAMPFAARNVLCWLIGLVLLALLAAPAAAEPEKEPPRPQLDQYTSPDKPIPLHPFHPPANGKFPAIVFLPAIDGLDDRYGEFYRARAAEYAGKGYVVVLPHYFDRTPGEEDRKAIRATLLRYARDPNPTEQERQTVADHFGAWSAAVRDAVAYVRALPGVDGERVGLVGFSLGGFLALSAAAEEDLKIAAGGDFFGGLPAERRGRGERGAPGADRPPRQERPPAAGGGGGGPGVVAAHPPAGAGDC